MFTARVPTIDWERGFHRRWNGGDTCATHAFNALSFLFPQGEAFFVAVVRDVRARVVLAKDEGLARAVSVFVAQESIHARQHERYNAVLEQQGFRNVARRWIDWLQRNAWRHRSPVTRLAIVCSYEHYTATLGAYLLDRPDVLAQAHADLALVWGWHAAEETEHKAVCFDLYRAAGGGYLRRVLVHAVVSTNFAFMFGWQYCHLLKQDGGLRMRNLIATIRGTSRFFFGRDGVGWAVLRGAVRYCRPRFHPWEVDNHAELQAWLSANATRLRSVS